MGLPFLVRAMETVGQALVEMRDAVDPRVTLEVALIRLASPSADMSPAALLERIERLERAMGEKGAAAAHTSEPARTRLSANTSSPAEPQAAPPGNVGRPAQAQPAQAQSADSQPAQGPRQLPAPPPPRTPQPPHATHCSRPPLQPRPSSQPPLSPFAAPCRPALCRPSPLPPSPLPPNPPPPNPLPPNPPLRPAICSAAICSPANGRAWGYLPRPDDEHVPVPRPIARRRRSLDRKSRHFLRREAAQKSAWPRHELLLAATN